MPGLKGRAYKPHVLGPLSRRGQRVGGPWIAHQLRGLDPRTLERQARRHRQRRLRQYAEHARHAAGPGGGLRGDWRRHRPPDGDTRRPVVGRGPPGANHRLGIALDSRHHRTRPADRRSGRRPGGPALVLQRLLDRRTPGVRGDTALSTGLRRGRCRRAWQQSRPHKRRLPLAVPGQSPARRQRRHDHPRVEAADDHRGDRRRVRCDRRRQGRDRRRSAILPLRSRGAAVPRRFRRTGLPDGRAGWRVEHDVRRGEESTDRRTGLSRLAEEQRSAHGVGRRTAAVGLAAGTGGRRSRRA